MSSAHVATVEAGEVGATVEAVGSVMTAKKTNVEIDFSVHHKMSYLLMELHMRCQTQGCT